MAELKLKSLKKMLDGDQLDLSAQQISAIPVNALSFLPNARIIDFSNNTIVKIPDKFCELTFLMKLDFACNHIAFLPENFGDLINLKYLDLFRNSIEDLPSSFGNLKKLKWLDLKHNPLVEDLQGICDKNNQKEENYEKLAMDVVIHVQKRCCDDRESFDDHADVKSSSAEVADNATNSQKGKDKVKRKKNKKMKESSDIFHETTTKTTKQQVAWKNKDAATHRSVGPKTPRHHFCWHLFKSLTFVFSVTVCIILFAIFHNCMRKNQWIPSSKPFCKDLEALTTTFKFEKNFSMHFAATLYSLLHVLHIAASGALRTTSLIVYGYYVYLHNILSEWSAGASIALKPLMDDLFVVMKVFILMLADAFHLMLENGSAVVKFFMERISYHIQHIEDYWIKLQSYFTDTRR